MNDIFHIHIDDFNEQFVRDIQSNFGSAELEIKVKPQLPNELPIMDEELFWKIIATIHFKTEQTHSIEIAAEKLAQLTIQDIYIFQDILSEKLFLLDTEQQALHAQNVAYQTDDWSADLFLYARCAAVAKGRDFYQNTLNYTQKIGISGFFERLLNLPNQAYQLKTTQPLERIPAYNYETFFNPIGWGEKAIRF